MKAFFTGLSVLLLLTVFCGQALAAHVSMNKGSAEELLSIPYTTMTEEQAKAVISWRQEHGPFQTPADVKRVPGMTDTVWTRMGLVNAPDGDVVWDTDLQEADDEQPPQMHGY